MAGNSTRCNNSGVSPTRIGYVYPHPVKVQISPASINSVSYSISWVFSLTVNSSTNSKIAMSCCLSSMYSS